MKKIDFHKDFEGDQNQIQQIKDTLYRGGFIKGNGYVYLKNIKTPLKLKFGVYHHLRSSELVKYNAVEDFAALPEIFDKVFKEYKAWKLLGVDPDGKS